MKISELPSLVDEATACKILGGEHTPIHRSTLHRGIKEGRFPKPLKIARVNRWRVVDLARVLERAASARGEVSEALDRSV